MSFSSVTTFDTAGHFSFSSTLVEVSGGAIRLKDLGGATYSLANPAVETQHQIQASVLSSFSESKSVAGSDNVKYQLIINGVAYWVTGGVWQASDESYDEANTAAEISAGLATLVADLSLASAFYVKLRAFLHSADGTTRPTLTSATIGYTNVYAAPVTISECLVYAYLTDLLGADYVYDSTKPVTLHVKAPRAFFHGSKLVRPFEKNVAFNSSGYAELSVIETATPGEYLQFFLTYYEGTAKKSVSFLPCQVPDAATASLSSIAAVRTSDFG